MCLKRKNDFLIISEGMIDAMKGNYVTDVVEMHLKTIKSYLGKNFLRNNAVIFHNNYEMLDHFNWFENNSLDTILCYQNNQAGMVAFCDFTNYVLHKSMEKIDYLWYFMEDYIKVGGALRCDGERIKSVSELKNKLEKIRNNKLNN